MKDVVIGAFYLLAFCSIPACTYGVAKLSSEQEIRCLELGGQMDSSWGRNYCRINNKEQDNAS